MYESCLDLRPSTSGGVTETCLSCMQSSEQVIARKRHISYLRAACVANTCILIRSCCLIFCFSPGDKVSLVFGLLVGSEVDVLLLMVEYVETGLFFCSSLVQDDVDEVVLIEAVSEELELLVRRENGLDGIFVDMMDEVCFWYGSLVLLSAWDDEGMKLVRSGLGNCNVLWSKEESRRRRYGLHIGNSVPEGTTRWYKNISTWICQATTQTYLELFMLLGHNT